MNPPASEMTWINAQPDGVVLTLRVIPRAPRDAVDGVLGDALKVRLQAPPSVVRPASLSPLYSRLEPLSGPPTKWRLV